MDPNAYDFVGWCDQLTAFEDGKNVPSLPPLPLSAQGARWNDYTPALHGYIRAVIAAHLEVSERPNPVSDMRRVVELAREVYVGEWWLHFRKSPKRDKYPTPAHEVRSRFMEFWLTDYCYGVLCALALDDEESAGRLACFVGPDLIIDEGRRNLRRSEMSFHLVLASYLRYGDFESVLDSWLKPVRDDKSVRAKLWLKALRALDKGKAEAFSDVFMEVAAHHRQHEYSRDVGNGPSSLLMQEGSILWHLARRKGIAPAWHELPVEVSDHLLTAETVRRRG